VEHLDPRVITQADWVTLKNLVWFLWLLVFCNVAFGACMLVGHGVIPSLVTTAHITQRFQRFRPLLYIFGILALSAALFVITTWASTLGVIYDIYPKRLI